MDAEVARHLAAVTPASRRRDADTLLEMMGRITGEPPRMWATVIGFGSYHYRYASGREGDAPAAAFAPRRAATTVYLVDGVEAHEDMLERLGPHRRGVGCLYITDLAAVDLDVLEAVVRRSHARLLAGEIYTRRARDGGADDAG